MEYLQINPIPSQEIRANLGDQPCSISIYQKSTGLFLDLSVNDSPIVVGRLALNGNMLVKDSYLGFVGDLMFIDLIADEDPRYDELGSRFMLVYVA